MAKTISDNQIPTIFNQIIRQRVAEYIDKEVKEIIKTKMDQIITDVLKNLQTDSNLFTDMLQYERKLVIKAIYNGEDIGHEDK